MRTTSVSADRHRLEEYADVFRGYKAVQLLDDTGTMRGELVWRLATGDAVEITERGIFDQGDRTQGWASMLIEAGIESMREFFTETGRRLRRIYLFCDSINEAGRAFYEARGFALATILKDFYHYSDAALYVRNMEGSNAA